MLKAYRRPYELFCIRIIVSKSFDIAFKIDSLLAISPALDRIEHTLSQNEVYYARLFRIYPNYHFLCLL